MSPNAELAPPEGTYWEGGRHLFLIGAPDDGGEWFSVYVWDDWHGADTRGRPALVRHSVDTWAAVVRAYRLSPVAREVRHRMDG